ncbi:hypothetical protein Btru_048484 [Bulinus truncatus]|nr:hypothetical protein Btru_048484 [Bulinus truncatus]
MVITIVLGVVASCLTVSTIVACYKYYSSTRTMEPNESNYDQLDVRLNDPVTYHKAQGISLPAARASERRSAPRIYPGDDHHPYSPAIEPAPEASPYAEIGDIGPEERAQSNR